MDGASDLGPRPDAVDMKHAARLAALAEELQDLFHQVWVSEAEWRFYDRVDLEVRRQWHHHD